MSLSGSLHKGNIIIILFGICRLNVRPLGRRWPVTSLIQFSKVSHEETFIRNLISISRNALKLTYSKVECRKIVLGRNPRTPAPGEAAAEEGSVWYGGGKGWGGEEPIQPPNADFWLRHCLRRGKKRKFVDDDAFVYVHNNSNKDATVHYWTWERKKLLSRKISCI